MNITIINNQENLGTLIDPLSFPNILKTKGFILLFASFYTIFATS